MGETYPELLDSRCFFHPMRKVSNEFLEVLYSSEFLLYFSSQNEFSP